MNKISSFLFVVGALLLAISCSDRQAENVSYAAPCGEGEWKKNLDLYQKTWPQKFGIGRQASKERIKKWDIDVNPQGERLPKGEGLASRGKEIYLAKCASCHGKNGHEGPYDQLVVTDTSKRNTIGNYWPYATTIFDYVRRAMPFNAPGSLSDQEVYDVTAYLLYRNKIIEEEYPVNANTLPQIEMPAKSRFVLDDRRGGNEIK